MELPRGRREWMRSIQEIDRELERTRQKAARLRKLDVSVEDIERQLKRRRITEQEARHILEQEPERLSELKGVTRKKAMEISASFP